MSLTDKVKGFQGYKGVSDPENLSSSELKVQNHILKNQVRELSDKVNQDGTFDVQSLLEENLKLKEHLFDLADDEKKKSILSQKGNFLESLENLAHPSKEGGLESEIEKMENVLKLRRLEEFDKNLETLLNGQFLETPSLSRADPLTEKLYALSEILKVKSEKDPDTYSSQLQREKHLSEEKQRFEKLSEAMVKLESELLKKERELNRNGALVAEEFKTTGLTE